MRGPGRSERGPSIAAALEQKLRISRPEPLPSKEAQATARSIAAAADSDECVHLTSSFADAPAPPLDFSMAMASCSSHLSSWSIRTHFDRSVFQVEQLPGGAWIFSAVSVSNCVVRRRRRRRCSQSGSALTNSSILISEIEDDPSQSGHTELKNMVSLNKNEFPEPTVSSNTTE